MDSEPLSSQFSGVLGIALPRNSIITNVIPAQDSDAPDGATFSSNLFSMTPADTAPLPFFGLSLERPGSDAVPSYLSIGRHPSALVPDSKLQDINYDVVQADPEGTLYWKARATALTVYVNGTGNDISLGGDGGIGGGVNAILDSGVPVILTTRDVADAIYGSVQVQLGKDGNCKSHSVLSMSHFQPP